jgi:CheY-like chemotaxis protein
VLLVEDEPENQLVVGLILRTEGFEVIGTEEGGAAAGMARAERPDVILLDVMMPEVNGFQVLERLRADPETASIPVILLTALAQRRDVELAIEAGVAGYITKPFEPEDLIRRITSVLESRSTGSTGGRA